MITGMMTDSRTRVYLPYRVQMNMDSTMDDERNRRGRKRKM
jgi:hypothetical protein